MARPGVIDCTVFHGFPFSDISIVGTSVIVTTDDDPELAKAVGIGLYPTVALETQLLKVFGNLG
jgi:microcystin degradation protein MlrC